MVESDEQFLERVKAENRAGLQRLADQFGGEITADGEWLSPIRKFQGSDYSTLAHIAVEVGAFKSVGEAKRNGWNRPPVPGSYTVGRTRLEVL